MPNIGKGASLSKMTFEQLMAEFEKIVAELEEGQTPLEKSIELFERGMQISAEGSRRLDEAEKKIHILIEQNGRAEKVPFETGGETQYEDEE